MEVSNPVAALLAFIFHSTKTSGDSSSLVESRPTILGGSWIKIWMRTYGCNARTMSANSVSYRTCRTAVSVPVASSAEILSLGGRTSPINSKTVSTRVEIESGSTVRSRCPARVAVTCTVRTTTRNGRASRGTGSIPDLSVITPRLDGNRYNRLIHRPLEAGQLKAARYAASSGVSANAVSSCVVISCPSRSTCSRSLSKVLYIKCSPWASSWNRVVSPLCTNLTVRRRSRMVTISSWAVSKPYSIILVDGGTDSPWPAKRAKAMGLDSEGYLPAQPWGGNRNARILQGTKEAQCAVHGQNGRRDSQSNFEYKDDIHSSSRTKVNGAGKMKLQGVLGVSRYQWNDGGGYNHLASLRPDGRSTLVGFYLSPHQN